MEREAIRICALGWKEVPKKREKKQSMKPSNDKYRIAMWSEYDSHSLRMAWQIIRDEEEKPICM